MANKKGNKDSDYWKKVHDKSLEGLIKNLTDSRNRVEKKEMPDIWKEIHDKSLEGLYDKTEKGEA